MVEPQAHLLHNAAYLRSDFAVIAILIAYLAVAALAFYSGRQNERRTYEPHQHAISAANAAQERCAGRELRATAECVIEEIAAAEQTSRDEQDLQAQQQMALWALLMVIVSAATVGVTVWALIYVKQTLDETRGMAADTSRMADEATRATGTALRAARIGNEANEIARDTTRRQLRPHVYVVDVTAKVSAMPHYMDPKSYFVSCSVALRNFGQAPAKKVKGFARCFVGNMWNSPFDAALADAAEVPLANIPPSHTVPLEPYTTEFPVGMPYQNILSGGQSIFVEGQVQYVDWTGDEHYTNFRFACSGDDFDVNAPKFRPCPDWNDAT